MKKNLLFIALVFLVSLSALAQDTIPNGGFENWIHDGGSFSDAYNWASTNFQDSAACPSAGVAPETADVHSGRYAARLTTLSCTGVNTIAFMEAVNQSAGTYYFPVSTKPLSLQGWYKYAPAGSDTAEVMIQFSNNASQVGLGGIPLYATNTWTKFEVPVTYTGGATPNNCEIYLSSSLLNNNTFTGGSAGSVFLVDDLSFSYFQSGISPVYTTDPASNVQLTSAQLNGTVNANSSSLTVLFEYGPTSSYGGAVAATPGTVSGNTNTSVNASISGLTPNTTYYYRVGISASGNTFYGNQQTFYTSISDTPVVTTSPASNVQSTSVQLNGVVNANNSLDTAISFEWGPSASYGNSNAATPDVVNGATPTNVSTSLYGLLTHTTYYYRTVVTAYGLKYYGAQQQFTTGVTGISQLNTENISIYPNPAKHQFTVNTHCNETYTLELYNMLGQKTLSQIISQPVSTMDVSTLAGGIYTVTLKKDEAVKSYRLVIVNE